MNSLIEVAEKKFENKLPFVNKNRLAMKVFKIHLFKRFLPSPTSSSSQIPLMAYLEENVKEMDFFTETGEALFANIVSTFYYQNALSPTSSVQLLSDLIKAALKLKNNCDVKKLIDIGMNLKFIQGEESTNETEKELKSDFFIACSYAYNMTRNIEKAIGLLRKVEERSDMAFSISLFNNVIEC